MAFVPGIMVSTRVKPDRVADFEQWVRVVVEASVLIDGVMPVIRWFRQWDVTDPGVDGVEYIVLGEGSDLSSFDLEPVLVAVYGPDRAQAELDQFVSMLVDDQNAWSLLPYDGSES